MSVDDPLERDRQLTRSSWYERLQVDARGTRIGLEEVWGRPNGDNREIERKALWFAIGLNFSCRNVVEHGKFLLQPRRVASAVTRYEIQAGMLTVHSMFPFTYEEGSDLWGPGKKSQDMEGWIRDGSDEGVAFREPELLDRWHRWIWEDEAGNQQIEREAVGPSAVFAEACGRLALHIDEVIRPQA